MQLDTVVKDDGDPPLSSVHNMFSKNVLQQKLCNLDIGEEPELSSCQTSCRPSPNQHQ